MTQPIDTSIYATVTEAIRGEAQRLLVAGEVTTVIGYTAARRTGSVQPIIINNADDAAKLIFTPASVNNLALYLTKAKKEISKKGKIGIVVKGCDLKAIVGLLGEAQLKREDLYLIGVPCAGVLASTTYPATALTEDSIASKCRECSAQLPTGCDFVPNIQLPAQPHLEGKYAAEIARLEALTPAERWAYWKEQFAKCIKCYACRQVCPFCFCEDDTPPGRQHRLAHRPRHTPGRPLRRLCRMRTGLPDGYPVESPEPENGQGTEGTVRLRGRVRSQRQRAVDKL
jgi:formate dehydrogenase subunit beta